MKINNAKIYMYRMKIYSGNIFQIYDMVYKYVHT